jgi:hypothetical protein
VIFSRLSLWGFSSSNIIFGSFRTFRNGDAVGVGFPLVVPDMHNCADPCSLPTGKIMLTRLPTVFVGVSATDKLYSLVFAAFAMLASFILGKLAKKLMPADVNKIIEKILKQLIKKFFKNLRDSTAEKVRQWSDRANGVMGEESISIFEAEASGWDGRPQTGRISLC